MGIEDLKLVDKKDVIGGKRSGGLKRKGKTYTKYAIALKRIIPLLKDELEEKDVIRVKSKDIIKEMGREFEMKQPSSLLSGIRYAMFDEGIFLSMGKHKDGSDIYILRKVIVGDKLLDTLSDKLEMEKGNE